ncbi:hypothetical protein BH09VER1_BH09VER1_31630 [soil metagenome]
MIFRHLAVNAFLSEENTFLVGFRLPSFFICRHLKPFNRPSVSPLLFLMKLTTLLVSLITFTGLFQLRADEPPKVLFGPEVAGWETLVHPNGANQPDVSFVAAKDGVEISVKEKGTSGFPGIQIKPETPWNVSGYGRIDASVTNTSQKLMRLNMRVDDSTEETGAASMAVPPGETRTIPLYLDYASSKAKLKSSAIIGILIFGTKMPEAQTFRVNSITAAGPAGEKPPVDPKNVVTRPANGVLVGDGVSLDLSKQITPIGSGKAAAEPGKAGLRVDLSGGKADGITVKPVQGYWNLNDYYQVRVHLTNSGSTPVTPSVRVESKDSPTATVAASEPIAPGQSADIVVPFAASVPWQGVDDPDMSVTESKKNFKSTPGTGTTFVSHRVTGVTILGDETTGAKSLDVTSVAGENPTVELPAWIGQRPPVDGEWTKTFEDNFDGNAVDLTKWNIYAPNYWDKRTHFSKDNAIVKDGTLTLRVEKKTGHHNDDPAGKETDYATGFADTYGKWVQKYGYFEARVKLPKAPCLWPAFWLMPDRGLGKGDQGARQSTRFGGMEFDIVEQLSTWGSQRFNFAMHWDGYGKTHKATGSGGIYVPADKDGFIVVGLLWTPGSIVLYGNGKECARWSSPRISSVSSAILLDNVTGGWETEPLDDAQLPGDFVVDYVRVWQRKDLVNETDGPRPNKGTPAAPKE